jgi:hypothetical protein
MKIHVVCMGELVELTKTKYRAYLKELREKGSADLGNYGKILGRVYDVTDITRDNAATILDGGRCSWLPTID